MHPLKKSLLLILLIACVVASGWDQPNLVQAQASKGSIVALNTDSTSQNAVVTIESSQPIQYTAFKLLNPLRLVLDFPNMQKGNLSGTMQVKKGLVDSIRPLHFEEAGVLHLEIALNKAADYEILKPTENTLSIRLHSETLEIAQAVKSTSSNDKSNIKKAEPEDLKDAATILGEAEKIPDDSCYSMLYGKKENMTFEFQGADIRNVIRIFADISGFNIILSPGLTGTVNMRMIDVPWNEAMEVLLSNNGLGRECLENNLVRVAPQSTLAGEEAGRIAKKARIATDLAIQRNAEDLVTEVVRINNADITELSASLNALKSTRVDARITVDVRTNTIILNDLRQYVDDMLETIRILDVATAQVLIESKIVEINKSLTQELGVQWGFSGSLAQGNAITDGLTNSSIALESPDSGTTGGNFLVDLAQTSNIAAGTVSGFDLTLGSFAKGLTSVDIQLEALETQGKARIISSPKVTTADNKEARITSGSQIPYQTISTDGTTTEFVDAELSMTVVPHVTFDGKVYMTIDMTKNGSSDVITGTTIPTITTQETHTEVLVANGDTTVLGGIYTSNVAENKKAVPFFSKIPFLGVLFKSFDEFDVINELLVFVTPTIVDNGYN